MFFLIVVLDGRTDGHPEAMLAGKQAAWMDGCVREEGPVSSSFIDCRINCNSKHIRLTAYLNNSAKTHTKSALYLLMVAKQFFFVFVLY